MTETVYDAVREAAFSLIREIDAHREDEGKLRLGVEKSLKKLLSRDDLVGAGVYRKGNHITNTKYLYYDGKLQMTLDEFPKDKFIPPHDHGTWEVLALYRGQVKHTVYERVDDKSVEGHSKLNIIEDRVLNPGDVAMVIPPAEIHSFTALTDDTYSLTVVGDHYKPDRHYYNYEKETHVVRRAALAESKA